MSNRLRTEVVAMALAFAAIPAGAAAQAAPDMVSAGDPAGVAAAMKYAGYDAELTTDDYGDPLIKTHFGGYPGAVWFYGCDDESRRGCDSLQLAVGLDRAAPMTLEALNKIVIGRRFAAMHLDEEGDPWIKWDIVTDSGIPAPVFNASLREFSGQVSWIADQVFEEERAAR